LDSRGIGSSGVGKWARRVRGNLAKCMDETFLIGG